MYKFIHALILIVLEKYGHFFYFINRDIIDYCDIFHDNNHDFLNIAHP